MDHHEQYYFNEERANRPIEFIEKFCRHSKGQWAGKPIKLELFQKAYIAALFGFIDKETELRRFRESMFYVARKNGKTTMMAGLALYMMAADGEGGAEVANAASKREQAAILFDEAYHMVLQSPYLSKHIRKRKSDLFFPATFSKLVALSKNSRGADGANIHLACIDELHAI